MPTELMTLKEIAQQMKTSTRNIHMMISSGRFGPAIHKLGNRSVRVIEEEYTAWVAAGMPTKSQWQTIQKEGGEE